MAEKLSNVPSRSLGRCDMPANHDDEDHGSAGDGFYANCGECKKSLRHDDLIDGKRVRLREQANGQWPLNLCKACDEKG